MVASEILGENWLRINVSIYCNQILANFNNFFYKGNIIKSVTLCLPIIFDKIDKFKTFNRGTIHSDNLSYAKKGDKVKFL
jgi:hypothetical protein